MKLDLNFWEIVILFGKCWENIINVNNNIWNYIKDVVLWF